jgi:teichuronic acid biosynthesis glycosyltransferase TuaH
MSLLANRSEEKGGLTLVWFSEIQWDFLSTRKQRLLQRFPENWRILFIEPYALGRKQHWLPVKRGAVWVVTVPFLKTLPSGFLNVLESALVRGMISAVGTLWMQWWTRILNFRSPERIIGLSNIYWGAAAARMACRLRFYDANDDHLGFTSSPRWLEVSLERYLAAADLLFYVSPELLERLHPFFRGRSVELGNGVDFNHFSAKRAEIPAMMASIPKPVLGYAGSMDWLDTGLLERTAKAWPEYQIVLVGPAYSKGWWERQDGLRTLSNVHYLGKVEYRDLPACVQQFDLALMPLERSDLKRASHPNKLYEYTAAGVPVLAIDYCSALDSARDIVMVASSDEEFVRLVPEAMADTRREERQAFARLHSWDSLAARMVGELAAAWKGAGA